MKFELFPGVQVNFIKNQQFKSVQMMISFIKKITDKKELAKRTLLASVLEASSAKYPNQHAITLKLAELYGATFGTTAEVEGNLSLLNFVYSFVEPKYLDNATDLLENSVAFLNQIIFHPKMQHQLFDENVFERQKANLMTYIKGIQDNKQSEALLKIQELYFENEVQKHTPYGSAADFEQVTNGELSKAYQEMLQTDQVQITVMGDLRLNELKQALQQLEFNGQNLTQSFATQLCYHQSETAVRRQELIEPIQQSKLDLIYQLPIDAQDDDFFAAVVFNALLGGSAQSKLFKNVREKASLAYYAESSYSALRSIVLIQTGIQSNRKQEAMELIQAQVEKLKTGEFTTAELKKIKIELINERLQMQDNPMNLLEQQVLSNLLETDLSFEYQCQAIQKVTKEKVIKVANQMKFQAEFFLKGEVDDGNN